MRVSTLIRQLDDLNKHHANGTVSVVTPTAWYQEYQVLGLRHLPDSKLVVLHQQVLAPGRRGFRVYELGRILSSSAEPEWSVMLKTEFDTVPTIGVTLFTEGTLPRSTGFINDHGEPVKVAVDDNGQLVVTTCAAVPLKLVEDIYQWASFTEDLQVPLPMYELIKELRGLVNDSLGLQP